MGFFDKLFKRNKKDAKPDPKKFQTFTTYTPTVPLNWQSADQTTRKTNKITTSTTGNLSKSTKKLLTKEMPLERPKSYITRDINKSKKMTEKIKSATTSLKKESTPSVPLTETIGIKPSTRPAIPTKSLPSKNSNKKIPQLEQKEKPLGLTNKVSSQASKQTQGTKKVPAEQTSKTEKKFSPTKKETAKVTNKKIAKDSK